MSMGGSVIGLIVMLLSLFLATMIPSTFPTLSTEAGDLLTFVVILIGISALIIGLAKR